MVMDGILADREIRSNQIKNLSKISDVACIKANVPGNVKNTPCSKVLVSYFTALLKNQGLTLEKTLSGLDGDCSIFLIKNGKTLKNKFVTLEEKHPLGRFIDIDVTLKNSSASLLRKKLRKCYICNNPAFYCGKIKAHTLFELLTHMESKTEEYLTSILSKTVEESMLKELNQNYKFGLVCKNTNGSHLDLNYKVMKRAVKAIKTPLAQCFFIGLNSNSCDNMLKLLRPIGLYCEEIMYGATGGANAYKGFIFIGGAILASVGYLINNSLPLSRLNDVVKSVCYGIDDDNNNQTFGYKAYHEKGFGGIRKLCLSDFQLVVNFSKKIDKQPLLKTLTEIVGAIDDSVLLKRSLTFQRYLYFKNLISNVDTTNKKQLKKINQQCLKNNVSIGGSADVLISSILLNKLVKLFNLGDL